MDPELLLVLLTTPWIILALLSAFGDALVGFVDEWLLTTLDKQNKTSNLDAPGKLLLVSGFFGIITASAIALLSLLIPSLFSLEITSVGLLLAVVAGCIEVLWLIPYFHAINKSGALDATPLLQSVPIFAVVIGVLFYQEIPTPIHLTGILAILIGALCLNYYPSSKKISLDTIFLMLLASAIIATGLFIFRDAAIASSIPTAILGNGLGMFLMSSCIWLCYTPYRIQFNTFVKTLNRKTLAAQGLNECLYTVSAIAGQLAVVLAPSVALASAFTAFHPLFTLLIAFALGLVGVRVYENKTRGALLLYKLTGVLLISTGTILLL